MDPVELKNRLERLKILVDGIDKAVYDCTVALKECKEHLDKIIKQ